MSVSQPASKDKSLKRRGAMSGLWNGPGDGLEHMARINEGNNSENLREREKKAIDAANEGRKN